MIVNYNYGWGAGYGIVMGIVLIGVLIYTIISVRKQAREAESSRRKSETKFSAEKQNENPKNGIQKKN